MRFKLSNFRETFQLQTFQLKTFQLLVFPTALSNLTRSGPGVELFFQFDPQKYEGQRQIEGFLAYMREHVKVKPMIIDGEPDDIVYDDYDDDVVAESEEEIDAKYGKEPEGFHDDENDEDEEEFDEDVDQDVDEVGAGDTIEDDGEDETGEDSWDNLKMEDFEFAIEKDSIPEARFSNVLRIQNRLLNLFVRFV